MDLKRKLELFTDSVKSISRHDDVDAAVRHAALDQAAAIIAAEREAIDARVQADIAAHLKGE
jgi:hypothetical protein